MAPNRTAFHLASTSKLRHKHSYEESSTSPALLRFGSASYPLPKPSRRQSARKKDESDAEKFSGAQESHGNSG
jgi:hypothetical protein